MTSRNIHIGLKSVLPIEQTDIEIVERKGIGHPDSMADGVSEAVSRALCKEYLKRFGTYLHHNTDQVEVVGGFSNPSFGGGEVLRPIYMLLSGRATEKIGDDYVGVSTVAIRAAKEYLKDNLINLDVDSHMVIESKIGAGSADLVSVFGRSKTIPAANDTSFGVAFAPFSETEKLVYGTEKHLNSSSFKKKVPELGEDIKVMAMRKKNIIELTIAAAMVSGKVSNIDHYKSTIEEVRKEATELAKTVTDRKINVHVNTGDDIKRESVYLTVTGTSAEMGDDGSTGRGNRCNGLITPYRPMSMEATSGKNPVNHVGKIYNLLSNKMANEIVESVEGVGEAYVRVLSQIGKPIDQPLMANVEVIMEKGKPISAAEPKIKHVTDYWLENVTQITDMVVKGKLDTF